MPIIAELKQIDGDIWARVMQPVGEGSVCLWTDEEVRAHDKRVLASVDVAPPGTFSWALIQMKAGKKVRRSCWLPEMRVWLRSETFWQLQRTEEGVAGTFPFSHEDLLATDWSLYEGEKA